MIQSFIFYLPTGKRANRLDLILALAISNEPSGNQDFTLISIPDSDNIDLLFNITITKIGPNTGWKSNRKDGGREVENV